MVEFAATVRSAALRTRLDDALEGKGAFGRFRRRAGGRSGGA
jgi:hypothetical protein